MRKKTVFLLFAWFAFFSCTSVDISEKNDPEQNLKSQVQPSENRGEIEENTEGSVSETVVMINPPQHAFIFPLEDVSNQLDVIFPTWKSSNEEALMDGEKMKNPDSYESMCFRVVPKRFKDVFSVDSKGNGYKQYVEFQNEKCQPLAEIVNAALAQGKFAGYPRYTYAGVREGAQIYANVPLFGRKAREPLNDKFAVMSYSPLTWIRVSYPDFNIIFNGYEEELPTDFDEVFQAGTALFSYISDGFVFSFKDIPEERYKAITFSIEIPIEGEYFQLLFNGEDYPESYYTYEKRVLPNENRVLRGSVTVRFEE